MPVLVALLAVAASIAAPGAAPVAATSTDDAYSRSCASCHGPELRGGETGPALIGSGFLKRTVPFAECADNRLAEAAVGEGGRS